jgi:hypothetical protein
MFKKGPFAIESFVTIGFFDYDCIPILISKDNYLDKKI